MKVIIEYGVLHGQPLEKRNLPRGVRSIQDQQIPPGQDADFPLQTLEFAVDEGSQLAASIFELLGISVPPVSRE